MHMYSNTHIIHIYMIVSYQVWKCRTQIRYHRNNTKHDITSDIPTNSVFVTDAVYWCTVNVYLVPPVVETDVSNHKSQSATESHSWSPSTVSCFHYSGCLLSASHDDRCCFVGTSQTGLPTDNRSCYLHCGSEGNVHVRCFSCPLCSTRWFSGLICGHASSCQLYKYSVEQ